MENPFGERVRLVPSLERARSLLRLFTDSGDMTPYARAKIEDALDQYERSLTPRPFDFRELADAHVVPRSEGMER